MDFGELRSALHAAPSQQAWESLCAYLAAIREAHVLDQAIAYALPQLEKRWPANLRVLPETWWGALLEREPPRYLIYPARLSSPFPDRLIRIARVLDLSRHRVDVRSVDVRSGDLAQVIGAYKLSWIEQLVTPREIMNASDLRAVNTLLQESGLTHLDLNNFLSTYRPQINSDTAWDFFLALSPARAGQLRSLILARNNLTNDELTEIFACENLAGLTFLDLSHNRLDDLFVQYLIEAPLARQLEHLVIHGNDISSTALAALADAAILPALKTLNVREMTLGEEDEAQITARGVQVMRYDKNRALEIKLTGRSGEVESIVVRGPEAMIGRVRGNDVVLPRGNISRRHVKVWRDGDQIWAQDSYSTSGTYLNGHQIRGVTRVWPEDELHVGDFVITIDVITTPHEET